MRKLHFFSTLVALFLLATSSLWALPTGALPGGFTINSNCDMVYFSQGNLQYNSDEQKWQFADEQYEYIGNTSGNTNITTGGKANNTGVADLFGWVGASSVWNDELRSHGLTSSDATRKISGYGNVANENLKDDWGNLAISNGGNTTNSGWFTLKSTEWTYLINDRPNAILGQVNSTYVRYAGATLTIDAVEIQGIIIFPDGYAGGTPSGVIWGTLNSMNSWGTSCTQAGWEALEAAGCVFLPAAGIRFGTGVYSEGSEGYYRSSSPYTSDAGNAYLVYFSSSVTPAFKGSRSSGCSVRLVQDIPAAEAEALRPKASVATPPTAVTGLTYNGSSKTLVNAAGTATGGTVKYKLSPSGSWSTSLPHAYFAGEYTVQWFVEASGCIISSDVEEIHVTIARGTTSAPSPMPTIEAASLTYNGTPQDLVTATGELQSGYELVYSTDGTNWSTTIPQGTDLGNYTVYYKFYRGDNYEYVPSPSTIVATISDYPYVADNEDPTSKLEDFSDDGSMNLRVKRTIYADDEYNTICLPFALDASALASSQLAGYNRLKAFRGAQVSGTGASTNIDIFVEDATAIEAGVPYLISYPANHDDIVDPVFSGITVTTTEPGNVSADGVTFQGMFAQVHINQHNGTKDYLFLGENSQLYWPLTSENGNESVKMRGFRAYFIIDRDAIPAQVAPRGTHARFVNAPKQPTSIEEINTTNCTKFIENGQLIILKNGIKYNAQGQVLK